MTVVKQPLYDLVRHLRPQIPAKADYSLRRVGYRGNSPSMTLANAGSPSLMALANWSAFSPCRLKYSRYVDIQIVENEQQETVVRSLLRAYEHFGGVPMMSVFDNMSTVVKSREVLEDAYRQSPLDRAFRPNCVVVDCGFVPLACWPYRPQEKGSVENLVGVCQR